MCMRIFTHAYIHRYQTADGGQQDLVTLQDVFLRAEGDTFRNSQAKEGQVRICM